MAKPHPDNADGPFYVEDGCCILCGIPMEIAPGIFDWGPAGPSGETQTCVVKRQPASPQEIKRTLNAMISAEADCIRYRGENAEIARGIVEIGGASLLDNPPPPDAHVQYRDRVTFTVRSATAEETSATSLAGEFEAFLEATNEKREVLRYRIRRRRLKSASVRFSWFDKRYHTVEFEALKVKPGFVAFVQSNLFLPATQGLTRIVDEWLHASDRFENVEWFSPQEWRQRCPWQSP